MIGIPIGKLLKRAYLNLKPSRVKRLFFVLSTGRCGTRFISSVLDCAPNATVIHEPSPGCESINPVAYEMFINEREKFDKIKVTDFKLLKEHACVYKSIHTEVFGDCYNSIYPFAIALYNFYKEEGVGVKFIHLVRNPIECCSSILRAEGANGIEFRKDFGLRSKLLSRSKIPVEIASDVWIGINTVIRYQTEYIERLSPGTTRVIRIEDMVDIESIFELYDWLGLEKKAEIKAIQKLIRDTSYTVKHSHQGKLDKMGIPRNTEEDLTIIKEKTKDLFAFYGYSVNSGK